MAKPPYIELGRGPHAERLAILHEDRAALAVDKPPGWMLVPFTWQRTDRNLQAALQSSIGAGDFWARARQLRFLRHVHRLDADTTGVLLFGKSPGAVESLGALFESRRMEKRYLAVVRGTPPAAAWVCRHPLDKDPADVTRIVVSPRGKAAETAFRVLAARDGVALVEACPITGRTHQLRVHLAAEGLPILGDPLYGDGRGPLALRAVELAYRCPFQRRPVRIRAPEAAFLAAFGFGPASPTSAESPQSPPRGNAPR